MSTNRIICFMGGDAEAAAFVRARRRHETLVGFLQSLEAATCISGENVVEFYVPGPGTIAEGDSAIRWFLPSDEEDCRCYPVDELRTLDDLDRLKSIVIESLRQFSERIATAAARLEGGDA